MINEEKIQILYISSVCSEEKYSNLEKILKKPMQYSIQKFHNLIINGIAKNKNTFITALCGLPIDRTNTKKIKFKHENNTNQNIKYMHMGFLNIPIIKQISICLGVAKQLLLWHKKNRKNPNKIIICDAAYVTVTPIVIFISKILKIKKIAMVADIYGYMSDKIQDRGKINIVKKAITKMCMYCWKNYDGYVLLTEQMNNIVNPNNEPFIIMEGISEEKAFVSEKTTSKNYIMYAGSLYDRFGIKDLVDGFSMIDNRDIELHLYGIGETVEYILQKSKENNNIKYKGTKSNTEILNEEENAMLLINPRPSAGEFTKYSFPSKTIEYMLTGTPVLMTKLPGLPSEYFPYLYFIENENAEGIKESINKIINDLPREELIQKGKSAKKFVIENKNKEVQGKRIIELVMKVLEEGE